MSDQVMRSILLYMMGIILFFCGHSIGFNRAINLSMLKTYTVKLGDTPLIKIGKDGDATCAIGNAVSASPKDYTAVVHNGDFRMKVTGAQASE